MGNPVARQASSARAWERRMGTIEKDPPPPIMSLDEYRFVSKALSRDENGRAHTNRLTPSCHEEQAMAIRLLDREILKEDDESFYLTARGIASVDSIAPIRWGSLR